MSRTTASHRIMSTVSTISNPFATGSENHLIMVQRTTVLRPLRCTVAEGKLVLEYSSTNGTRGSDQWDTRISVFSLSQDLVLQVVMKVDGVAQTVTTNPVTFTNPPTVTLRKSGGGGFYSASEIKKKSFKGVLIGTLQTSKSGYILFPLKRK